MRTVVKVGTSTLAYSTGNLNIRHMEKLCRVLSDLKNAAERFSSAVEAGESDPVRKTLGELLFAAVEAARLTKTDPEEALHAECEERIRRVLDAEQQG